MVSDKYLADALDALHVIVNQTRKNNTDTLSFGITRNLDSISLMLKKIRTLMHDNRKRKIGVFGPPKRGKSTLLNALLGGDYLPTSTMPKTRCIVEICNIEGTKTQVSPHLVTFDGDGFTNYYHNLNSPKDFNECLERCFSREETAEKIEVYNNFTGGQIPANCILVDTPGAEVAFENNSHRESMGDRGAQLSLDTKRALRMLEEVDIPLFCMRADQTGSETERKFYSNYMQTIRPINIINFKDTCEEEEERDIIEGAIEGYKLIRKDTILVSAKDGLYAVKTGRDLSKSGIDKFSAKVNQRLKELEPDEGLKRYNIEVCSILSHLYSNKIKFNIPRVYMYNYIGCLDGFNDAGEMKNSVINSDWYRSEFL